MAPAAKIRALARDGRPADFTRKLLDSGSTANILRQDPDSLDFDASGISGYIAFATLSGKYIPPTPYRLRQRSALFRPGETFGLYAPRALKAFQIPNISTLRGDSIRKGAINGLIHA